VEANLPHFNREGLRYALEKQPAAVRQPLMAQHKELLQAAARQGTLAAEGQATAGESAPRRRQARALVAASGEQGAVPKRQRHKS
jgi:uncharacterized protein YciI